MHHRPLASLILAGCSAVAAAPQRAGRREGGGGPGSLLVHLRAAANRAAGGWSARLTPVGRRVAAGLLPLDEAAG
ncbi:hypothetical protein [Pseudoroseomonas cervicalis]|uniref:hypothetical protein n=1 Tax=Teichococcus cervicalis TaxID=204525 RepID=UPI0022F15A29|nr:hypothetical protein [Pseudoroseomonas cervicalis]WBV44408.1 hypothetical protein PFY06_07565 [Pseudoroseomonas cervicalis]